MDYLMTKYTVKSDMHLGEQVNDIGVRKAVKVTRGQIVEGNVITRFVFNKNTKGIEYKVPTTKFGQGRPSDGMDKFFIPLDNLETSTSSSTQTGSNISTLEPQIDLNTKGRFTVEGTGIEPTFVDFKTPQYKPYIKYDPNSRTVPELGLQIPEKNRPDVIEPVKEKKLFTAKNVLIALGVFSLVRLMIR
jgi:hypothetical protein